MMRLMSSSIVSSSAAPQKGGFTSLRFSSLIAGAGLALSASSALAQSVSPDGSGSPSPTSDCNHETGEGDVCRDEECCPCSGGSQGQPIVEGEKADGLLPVALHSGRKRELVHDLTVKVTGKDYRLTRMYESTPPDTSGDPVNPYQAGYDTFWDVVNIASCGVPTIGGPEVGNNWALGNIRAVFSHIKYACVDTNLNPEPDTLFWTTSTVILRPHRKPNIYNGMTRSGPGNQKMLGLSSGQEFRGDGACNAPTGCRPTLGQPTLEEPGRWSQTFGEDNGEGGWIAEDMDEYGNGRRYISQVDSPTGPDFYSKYGGATPDAILLNGDTLNESKQAGTLVEAWVWLRWDGERLYRAEAYRPDTAGTDVNGDAIGNEGKEILTQFVNYYYLAEDGSDLKIEYWNTSTETTDFLEDGSGDIVIDHDDLGSPGDLVMVETGEVVDSGEFRRKITQYRYHDDRTTGFTEAPDATDLDGEKYQLKMLIPPQQVEYAAQKKSDDSAPDEFTILDVAADMLALPDEGMTADKVYTENSQDVFMVDIAQKLVSYETTGDHRVTKQFLQAGDCGCSGGGSFAGARYEYSYLEWTDAGGEDGKTIKIKQDIFNDAAADDYDDHRIMWYDMYTPALAPDHVTYIRNIAIEDIQEGGNSPTDGEAWVRHFEYDGSTRALEAIYHPSAIASYTNAVGTTAPSVAFNDTTAEVGLREEMVYSIENVSEVAVTDAKETVSFTPVKTTYLTTQGRKHLPEKIERYQDETLTTADTVERTDYEYGFFSGTDSVQWRKTTEERELTGENGPGGDAISYDIFSENGDLLWQIDADDVVTKYEYDTGGSGELLKVTRNSDPPSASEVTAMNLGITNPFPTSANGDGELLTEYKYDQLGRVTQIIEPGSVSTYFARELREDGDREDLLYYTEVRLPHKLGGTPVEFNGPAMITLYDAASNMTRRSEFEIDGTDPYTPPATFTLDETGGELSRRVYDHDRTGSMIKSREWWHLADTVNVDPYETQYTFDGLGRATLVVDGNGTRISRVYDVLDRVTEMKIGTTSGNEKTVAEYFYDGAPGSAPTQDVGNGNLTHVKLEPDDSTSSDERVYRMYYDFRDRMIASYSPELPWEVYEYDNLNRVIERGIFDGVDSGDSTPPTLAQVEDNYTDLSGLSSGRLAKRKWYETYAYSQRGLRYNRTAAITPTTSSTDFLEWNWWYDEDGEELAAWAPNSPAFVRELDAHDRAIELYLSDRAGDVNPGATGNHAKAIAVDTDHVIEQTSYQYTDDDLLELITTRRMRHDLNDTGALDSTSTNAVATYLRYVYDAANRVQAVIDYGTNDDDFKTATAAPSLTMTPTLGDLRDDVNSTSIGTDVLFEWLTYNTRGFIEDRITTQVTSTSDSNDIVTRMIYDDLGRVAAVVENADAVEAGDLDFDHDAADWRWSLEDENLTHDDKDRVTSYVYDALDNVIKQVAHLPEVMSAEAFQETAYDYGVSAGSGSTASLISSENLLQAVRYPHEDTGVAGTTSEYKMTYAYNQLGELRAITDQNGTTREFTRDDLGRITEDRAEVLGTGVDDAIQMIEIGYDDLGRLDTVSSLDGTSSGTTENEVQIAYNDLWQIETVKQEHDGTIDSETPVVTYEYDTAEIGTGATGNHSRIDGIIYPSDSTTTLQIGYASGIDDRISRISGLDVDRLLSSDPDPLFDDLIDYQYIGLGVLARASIPEPGSVGLDGGYHLDRQIQGMNSSALTVGSVTQGKYTGYDRFGRLTRQLWVHDDYGTHASDSTVPNIPPLFEEKYSYERASNRLTADDVRPGAHLPNRDKAYTYDKLNRLTEATLSGTGATGTTDRFQDERWSLDLLGNWSTFEQDTDDDDTYEASGTPDESEGRTHNFANELGDITAGPTGGGTSNVTWEYEYDKNGNMTEQLRLVGLNGTGTVHTYDAWNRLVATEQDPGDKGMGVYEYNGLHWRIAKRMDTATGAHNGTDQHRRFFYSAGWQILEEHIDDPNTTSTYGTTDTISQFFWGPRYIDDLIAKRVDRDADEVWDDPETTAWFMLCDAIYSVRMVLDEEALPYERVDYDAYGEAAHRWAGDLDGDGDNDASDVSLIPSSKNIGDTGYIAEADLDFDGDNDFSDIIAWSGLPTYLNVALPEGWIGDPSSSDGPDNSTGYAGYRFNLESGNYEVRFRVYQPSLGRWLQRDSFEYIDGMSAYIYALSSPANYLDPDGRSAIAAVANTLAQFILSERANQSKRHPMHWYFATCEEFQDEIDRRERQLDALRKGMNKLGSGPDLLTPYHSIPTAFQENFVSALAQELAELGGDVALTGLESGADWYLKNSHILKDGLPRNMPSGSGGYLVGGLYAAIDASNGEYSDSAMGAGTTVLGGAAMAGKGILGGTGIGILADIGAIQARENFINAIENYPRSREYMKNKEMYDRLYADIHFRMIKAREMRRGLNCDCP